MGRDILFQPEQVPNGGINETRSPSQIADNQWQTGSNAEPLPDGVRSRQGLSKSNATALQTTDQFFEGGTNDLEFTDGTSEYVAQGFQLSANFNVSVISVRLKKVGSPTGNVFASVYDDNSGDPGSVISGLSNFDSVAAADIGTSYRWVRFVTGTPVALTGSTQYHIVLLHAKAAATGTDNIFVEESTAGGTYASGNRRVSTDGTTWVSTAAADVNFRVYGGTPTITGIFDYRLSDAATQRHLVFADREVYKNVSGTMTAVSTTDRQGFTADADVLPSFTVGQDRCRIAHGTTDTVSKVFYILSGTEYWENEGIDVPTATPTLAAVAGGSLATGTWSVDYFYWNNDLGIPSQRRYNGLNAATVALTAGNQTIRITNLPAAVARAGDRATHIRIELKSPTGSVFRFAGTSEGQVTLGTTTTDITTDSTTTEAEYNFQVPPQHTVKQTAGNRQFLTGNSTNPWRVYYSHISGLTPYYEAFPTNNYRDFGRGDNDYPTALFFIPPRMLVVGCKNSLWVLDARQPGSSDAIQIAKGIGVAGHLGGFVVGRQLFFVSDGDVSKGMFRWPGSGLPLPILGIDDTFKGLSQTRIQYASCAHLAPGDNRFQWWTAIAASGSASQNRVLVYDYGLGAWTVYKHAVNFGVIGTIEDSSVNRIFAGGTAGIEYQADSTTTDDGTAITTTLTCKAFDMGSQQHFKQSRFIDYLAAGKSAGSITAELIADFGSRPSATTTLDHITDAATTWDDGATWDATLKWAGAANVTGRKGIRTYGKYLQPKFTSASDFHLKSYAIGFQPTGRR